MIVCGVEIGGFSYLYESTYGSLVPRRSRFSANFPKPLNFLLMVLTSIALPKFFPFWGKSDDENNSEREAVLKYPRHHSSKAARPSTLTGCAN